MQSKNGAWRWAMCRLPFGWWCDRRRSECSNKTENEINIHTLRSPVMLIAGIERDGRSRNCVETRTSDTPPLRFFFLQSLRINSTNEICLVPFFSLLSHILFPFFDAHVLCMDTLESFAARYVGCHRWNESRAFSFLR